MTQRGRACDDRAVMTARPLTFRRRAAPRVLAGVAGGFADEHGVDPFLVRAALVVLALAGGLGVVAYALGFAWSLDPAASTALGPSFDGERQPDRRRSIAFACMAAGLALVMRSAGLWLGDPFMIAVVVGAAGVGVVSDSGHEAARASAPNVQAAAARLPQMTEGRHARWRLVGGAVLVASGLVVVGTQHGVSGRIRFGAVATACTIIGVALVFGPWIARSAQDVAEERRRRIRSDERAEVAAHLHDSVLQTLALIQRSADDPRRTITLARRQERELRAWLFGEASDAVSLAAALRTMAEDVEVRHDVTIEVVIVGDRPMDEAGTTVVGAAREACVNAAEHSGMHDVSVFAEIRNAAVEVFVRDRGRGFVRSAVAADRHGIADSIEARVRRAGGSVDIDSSPGAGTEVRLVLPLDAHPDEASP